jgi:hypothetical protein
LAVAAGRFATEANAYEGIDGDEQPTRTEAASNTPQVRIERTIHALLLRHSVTEIAPQIGFL